MTTPLFICHKQDLFLPFTGGIPQWHLWASQLFLWVLVLRCRDAACLLTRLKLPLLPSGWPPSSFISQSDARTSDLIWSTSAERLLAPSWVDRAAVIHCLADWKKGKMVSDTSDVLSFNYHALLFLGSSSRGSYLIITCKVKPTVSIRYYSYSVEGELIWRSYSQVKSATSALFA